MIDVLGVNVARPLPDQPRSGSAEDFLLAGLQPPLVLDDAGSGIGDLA